MNGEVIQPDSHDFVFKFVIIGDSGVGKSCIMHHFIYNKCKYNMTILVRKETTHTIGVEFSSKTLRMGNKDIKLQIWDTAGQEKFRYFKFVYF